MSDPSQTQPPSGPLDAAIARLDAAIDALESAAEAAGQVTDTAPEVQRMADDRARLARELDAATARAERLSQVNSEVSRRLVGAMETVKKVLDGSPAD